MIPGERAISTTRLQDDERGQNSEPLKGGWGLPVETKGRQLVRTVTHSSPHAPLCLLSEASVILTGLGALAQLKLTGKWIMGVGIEVSSGARTLGVCITI